MNTKMEMYLPNKVSPVDSYGMDTIAFGDLWDVYRRLRRCPFHFDIWFGYWLKNFFAKRNIEGSC